MIIFDPTHFKVTIALKVQQGDIKEVVMFAIRQVYLQNPLKLANPKQTSFSSVKLCC